MTLTTLLQSSAEVQNEWSMERGNFIFLVTSSCESGRNIDCSFIQSNTKWMCWIGKEGNALASARNETKLNEGRRVWSCGDFVASVRRRVNGQIAALVAVPWREEPGGGLIYQGL